jgi:Domain of unknown function (DUF4157)
MNSVLHKNNAAAHRVLRTKPLMLQGKAKPFVQAKLTVNEPGDIYEQEADAMSDRVMRMSSNETVKPVTGLIGKSLQRKCAHCEDEEKKKKPIMRKAEAGYAGMSVSSSFASSLNASKGGGSPLAEGTRNFMENAFSADFSGVKIHTNSEAAEMSKGINAKAFTTGDDIYFNEVQYNPDSSSGKHLLAHELTHVVQQRALKTQRNKTSTSSIQRITYHSDTGGGPGHPLPRPACANLGVSRILDLQPVFMRTDPTDASPTGVSWARRVNEANMIWGKIGVTFNALAPITLDTALKSTGATVAEVLNIMALRSGTGIEVFLADNELAVLGGGGTTAGCSGSGKVVISDGGTSDTLLAHELSHTLFNTTTHPGDPGTIAIGSGSRDTDNSRRNTMVNFALLRCPAPGGPTCLNPDV